MGTNDFAPPATNIYGAFGIDWKREIARFGTEVEAVKRRGVGDPLLLADMECSLDLLSAELVSLRGRRNPDEECRRAVVKTLELQGTLAGLIRQIRPITRD